MKTFSCFTVYIAVFLLSMAPDVYAQEPNILDTMMKAQEAVVSIKSDIVGLYKSPSANVAFDKRTGRLLAQRKLAKASYSRLGAGVLIHSSGIIVTNAHTVNLANSVTIRFSDETTAKAKILKVVKDLDIALLKVNLPKPIQPIELANSNSVNLGDHVITIGNSEFLKQTVTGGRVKGIGTSRSLKHKRTDLIQTTINLYEGDSGGPLFNDSGELIGLMTAKETAADHSSFAIPSNRIKYFLIEYLDKNRK